MEVTPHRGTLRGRQIDKYVMCDTITRQLTEMLAQDGGVIKVIHNQLAQRVGLRILI